MRTAVHLSTTVVLAAAASACTGDDDTDAKKYTVPTSLCGVAVDPALVEPLLPGGDAISSSATEPNGGTDRCDVSVDGKVALRLSQAWWGSEERVTGVAQGYAGADDGTVSADERFVYAGKGGVGKAASCASSAHPDQDLYAVAQVLAPDVDDQGAMKKLITGYTKAVEQSKACR